MFIPQIPNRLFKFQSLTKDITEWFKIVTHDTAYWLINSKTKEIFAISSERIIRRKHSAFSILNFFDLNGINLQNIKIQSSFFLPDKFLSRFFELYNLEKILLLIYWDKKDRVKYSRIIEITLLLFRSPLFFLELLYQRLFHVFSSKFKPYIVGNDHHLCHALPAYYFSPFYWSKSLIFILDAGSDTWYSSLWEADDNNIVLLSETKFKKIWYKKNSNLSWLYSLFTRTLGFAPLSDEGKTEALAAYG